LDPKLTLIIEAKKLQVHLRRCNEARKLKDCDRLVKDTMLEISDDADSALQISADVARGHGGDDRPPTHHIPTDSGVALLTEGDAFVLPYLAKVPVEQKAVILTKIGRWTDINAGIQQHLQKLYNTNKASLKAAYWVINPETETYGVESIRQRRPENITPKDWDAQLAFWNDPRNQARAAQNHQNRAKSTVVCRQGSLSLARFRYQMMESSSNRESSALIHTFFVTHTVGGVFVRDEDRALYRLGSNTETGVPYTEEEIMAIVRKGKQRGHLPGVGSVLSRRATGGCPPPPQSTVDPVDVEKLKKCNKSLTKQVKMMMRFFRSKNNCSQMLDQFESSPEFGGPSESGRCGDDELGGDEDGDEDEEDGDS
nr:hypothetical protein [Tanacetum cinerariifolium]